MGKVAVGKEEKVMLFQGAPRTDQEIIASFDEHAVAIAKRQYFMPEDKDLLGMFRRVANWVASPEHGEHKRIYAQAFYDLMTSKRFCPGGRVLAGAGTQHGNVLNCFVQDGSPQKPGTNEWVTQLATKLALVTKVGGGNGLCLDPLSPKRPYTKGAGQLYVTIATNHADYEKVKTGTYMDLVHGKYVTKGYRYATFIEQSDVPASLPKLTVGDSVEKIWSGGSDMIMRLLKGEDVLLDLSSLRPEGTPVNGSGGNSSGPSSFAVEVFDNFAYWASLGGADYAGPVATLRYIFAPTLRVIRQGGCLHPDTLVNTSRGTLRLREIVDVYEYGWQDHKLEVATDEGWKTSPRGFNNGNAPTLLVKLENGQEIQGTPNHKLKVMREDGKREWVRLEDLKSGDYVIQVLDQHTGSAVTLSPLGAQHHNTKEIKTPEVLTERLAFFLGYLWGDGFISDNRIGFAVSHDSPMMVETPKLFKELFDLEVRLEQKEDDKSAIFVTRSRALTDWLAQNGLHKGRANDLELPRAIRQASRPIVAAFLRGLFEADGTVTVGYPVLSSSSKQLVKDVAVMLGGLGIPTTMRTVTASANRYSEKPCHHLKVVSAKGLELFLERIGYMEGSRFAALTEFKPDTARESSWVLPHASALLQTTFDALPAGVKNHPSVYTQSRKTISRYIRGERQLTATGYERLQHSALVADKLPEFAYDEYYVPVKSVEDGGRILTLDISVDENKTYLANGVVSHNTRRGAGMATMSITHPDIQDFITSKDLDREQTEGDISTFNISVLVTDGFMAQATKQGKQGVLWDIADHAWQTGEPGLIYIDRINEQNAMRETLGDIKSTNPCGEIPLYAGEPCDLGAINLAAYVQTPNIGMKGFDVEGFQADVRTCIRFLDNVLEVNKFALEDNRQMSLKLRRLGLGVMGLADALIMMGYRYDDERGREAVAQMIGELRDNATEASEQLAKERGAFPGIKDSTVKTERRNVAVLTVAPTGTTSMLMGVSSGVEPVFAPFIFRKIGDSYASLIHPLFQELLERHAPHADYTKDGKWDLEKVVQAVQDNHGSVQGLDFIPDDVKAVLICAHDISPEAHVKMQGVVQSSFDGGGKQIANSISKTINMPNEATVEDVFRAYSLAFETGCKGITVYRDGSRQFQVLSTKAEKKEDQKSFKDDTTTSQAPVIVTPPVNKPVTANTALQNALTASRSEYLPGEPLFERPGRLSGFTDVVKLMLPTGEKRGFYVTVNSQDGLPTEVFIVSGKAGDEANADSEALGRMVSIALQYGVPAEVVVKTLRGINGGMYGTYQGRMAASKADLIAIALETAGVQNVEKTKGGKSCPECGGKHLRYEEGCVKCDVCGYSKCG
jgi:ribonucleotide reductase alpha subunit/intein/homing endonuclease